MRCGTLSIKRPAKTHTGLRVRAVPSEYSLPALSMEGDEVSCQKLKLPLDSYILLHVQETS